MYVIRNLADDTYLSVFRDINRAYLVGWVEHPRKAIRYRTRTQAAKALHKLMRSGRRELSIDLCSVWGDKVIIQSSIKGFQWL